jgi:lipoprotein-anchoring transpeptidase ErfK/SrfK
MVAARIAAAAATAAFVFPSVTAAGTPPSPPAAQPTVHLPRAYPAAGELVWAAVPVRVRPSAGARPITIFRQFRSDFRRRIVFATGDATSADGRAWLHVSVPKRPNGTMGWIPAASVSVTTVQARIEIHRQSRRIELLRGDRLVFGAKVAVGAPGRETPLGHFYVTARFVPDDPFLGVFALETSAYSRLTEWPGGGIVGIHGTSMPQLLGRAVSHGCVRVSNASAKVFERLAPLGTAITIDDR